MELSKFAKKYTTDSGINSLMVDLGDALAQPGEILMLGGGNPGQVPEVEKYFQNRLLQIANSPDLFRQAIGNYANPTGEETFRTALAKLLHKTYGWEITKEHIALTAGSQNGLYLVFNALAGTFDDGTQKHILLPLSPEYIGYKDQGLSHNMFRSQKPTITFLDNNQYKYGVDFSALQITDKTAAICTSRPTNPTGNVLTDAEMQQLDALCKENNIPLIIDSAYGVPFPHITFTDATPIWNENIILSLSLSKLGLPATRTGILIAKPEIIRLVSKINAITNLATGSIGAVLATELFETGEILTLSQEYIKPFYENKKNQALSWLRTALGDVSYHVHKPEGALFLWVWFPKLPITSQELYTRLKKKGVLVIAGHHFYPGFREDWQHTHECIRITYAQQSDVVEKGIKLLAEECKSLYKKSV